MIQDCSPCDRKFLKGKSKQWSGDGATRKKTQMKITAINYTKATYRKQSAKLSINMRPLSYPNINKLMKTK